MLYRIFIITALLASLAVLAASIWIVCPAPFYNVWLLSVVASEWSLWLAALGLVGIVCALIAHALNRTKRLWWRVALVCGVVAAVCAVVPLFSGLHAAREHKVDLSFARYFAGVRGDALPSGDIKTYTFATVEGVELKLDAYLPPAGVEANGAGIVVVHGGSWRAGERGDFPYWNHWLASQGYTVFDVDYRLAPQPNWRTATGDVKCAVAWVKNHAAEFQLDANRLALLGRSAGGHLALLAGYAHDDARLPSSCEDATDTSVRAMVSFYAPTDLIWAYDNPANQRVIDGKATLRAFLGDSPHESDAMRERYLLTSPTMHVSPATPPTLLIHGGHDQLVRDENMRLLAARLAQAEMSHKTIFISYAQHGFDYNFNGFASQISQSVVLDFLRANLAAQTSTR
ncbi:MAG: alpha/beta hydrolase [Pyrinomonadaceae bacterium MAG19_C2-C3]|nr:alpha/beta hydrolase [Pyrinomonadaceae bacterium MAG19_C2-C3]